MKSRLLKGIALVAVLSLAIVIVQHHGTKNGEQLKIGIFQVVRQPVLDSMARAFRTELLVKMPGRHFSFETLVADGDTIKTEQIASKFASGAYDLVFVIGTNQAQSLAKKTTSLPIILGAATDPQSSGLVESWNAPGKNVTGTSDLSPLGAQLDALRTIMPSATRVGIIYNPAEANSNIIVTRFIAECNRRGMTPVSATINDQQQIRESVVSLVGRVDTLYAPTDATVQSALQVLMTAANEVHLPVFSCDRGSAAKGAIFSLGFDYSELGRISADMAADVLQHRNRPANMPIRLADKYQLYYNSSQIKRSRLTLPREWTNEGIEVAN